MCTAPIVKTVVEKEEERGEEEEDHIDTDLDEPEQVVEGDNNGNVGLRQRHVENLFEGD